VKGGDISNVSSPQVIATTTLVVSLKEVEERKLLSRKVTHVIDGIDMLAANKLWTLANNYGISLELAGFADQGWTEELLA
jgi:hypothetical protein